MQQSAGSERPPSRLRAVLPPVNFISIHYAYFIVVCLLASLIFWGSSHPTQRISYTDSLFLVVSAMTETGLNTVDLSTITLWQQILLFLLIISGSAIWVSIWTVQIRKHAFEERFKDLVRTDRLRRASRSSLVSLSRLRFMSAQGRPSLDAMPPPTMAETPDLISQSTPSPGKPGEKNAPQHIAFAETPYPCPETYPPTGMSTGAQHAYLARARRIGPQRQGQSMETEGGGKGEFSMRSIFARSASRNAQFHDLSREERRALGGCEYRALRVLAVIVPLYFCLWQLIGCIALGAWIKRHRPEPPLANGINPWWLGIFNGASAFNNSGMTLLDQNLIPFRDSYYVLITMGLLILAGNTAFPIFLRLILWGLLRALTATTLETDLCDLKETLQFILDYPRRVYTNLFPQRQTWWLVFMLILLNSVDWVAFELLNIGNPAVELLSKGSRIMDGLFQALAVRSGGFYVIAIPSLYIGVQVLYTIMMYIACFPITLTLRHTNVYEERSLGIYSGDPVPLDIESGLHSPSGVTGLARQLSHSGTSAIGRVFRHTFTWHGVGVRSASTNTGVDSRISFISQQIQGQLAHDMWWLAAAVFVIVTIETSNFLADPVTFSVFNVIFEVVSAYGCVGISVGLPNANYSFAGGWHIASKLVLCAVMLRGRHRNLPVALDRAVRLPRDEMHDEEEEEDHRLRRSVTIRGVGFEEG
ncbi:cation transport protein-domain-containing protein [Sordaria brevicollis]|uniref:Potassium transport protein n=1 Tax=Sordaria brevicollis TaxID=83679 RepID=A0AAE0U5F0_SORBR|nr:cation transport protein-domain-containing protein [Sordaria brevicollis]